MLSCEDNSESSNDSNPMASFSSLMSRIQSQVLIPFINNKHNRIQQQRTFQYKGHSQKLMDKHIGKLVIQASTFLYKLWQTDLIACVLVLNIKAQQYQYMIFYSFKNRKENCLSYENHVKEENYLLHIWWQELLLENLHKASSKTLFLFPSYKKST